MCCDIHSYAERKVGDRYELVNDRVFPTEYGAPHSAPFDWRSYGMYGFLAGVRNYSEVTPIV